MSMISMQTDIQKPQILLLLARNGFLTTLFTASLLGVVTAFGAYGFRELLGFFHNLLLLGKLSLNFDPLVYDDTNFWGWGIIFVPAVCGLAVVYIVRNFAPEAKGHGVPEVLDAVFNKNGHIRPRISFIKALASSITIGSGGSVGREGPIIQIGGAVGSFFGHKLKMEPWQKMTLVAAGAGAGIAATFNTPIGGILFAVELILSEISMRTIAPVIVACTMATFVARILIGDMTAFNIPSIATPEIINNDPQYWVYLCVLGVLVGGISFIFSRSIYLFEDTFEKYFPNPYKRHFIGMLFLGFIIWNLKMSFGHFYVSGVGYETIQTILNNASFNVSFLLYLVFLKIIATSITLGSGGSGGIFSPSLFIGAAFGCFIGGMVHGVWLDCPIPTPLFAVLCMAGMIAGTTHAIITAIIMMVEMTSSYSAVLEITCVASTAACISFIISSASIYTLKLIRRGDKIPLSKVATKDHPTY
ncbi:MAG: chloride channel protein [Candidatus Paracaedibacteraceae bacterium]|nr:chloride channel protein [Candidatus Paracaedibacteraceae bacterium]